MAMTGSVALAAQVRPLYPTKPKPAKKKAKPPAVKPKGKKEH